jgi:hypothetical protein
VAANADRDVLVVGAPRMECAIVSASGALAAHLAEAELGGAMQ